MISCDFQHRRCRQLYHNSSRDSNRNSIFAVLPRQIAKSCSCSSSIVREFRSISRWNLLLCLFVSSDCCCAIKDDQTRWRRIDEKAKTGHSRRWFSSSRLNYALPVWLYNRPLRLPTFVCGFNAKRSRLAVAMKAQITQSADQQVTRRFCSADLSPKRNAPMLQTFRSSQIYGNRYTLVSFRIRGEGKKPSRVRTSTALKFFFFSLAAWAHAVRQTQKTARKFLQKKNFFQYRNGFFVLATDQPENRLEQASLAWAVFDAKIKTFRSNFSWSWSTELCGDLSFVRCN